MSGCGPLHRGAAAGSAMASGSEQCNGQWRAVQWPAADESSAGAAGGAGLITASGLLLQWTLSLSFMD